MRYWAGLFGEADQETLLDGMNTMLKIAVKLLANLKQKDKKKLRITQGAKEDDGNDQWRRTEKN